LLGTIWSIWLVRGVSGGLSIRDAGGRGVLRRLLIGIGLGGNSFGIVVVVDWLSISVVAVSGDHWLSERDV
jgi:hypothetical protein